MAESLFAILECELLDRHAWPTRQGLATAVFDFIGVFYNRHAATQRWPTSALQLRAAPITSTCA